jgi:hypothetical protein
MIVRPAASTRDIAIVGAAAGLTAGLLMAMWATLTSIWHGVGLLASFELIGATFAGDSAAPAGIWSALYGIVLHAATSAGLGVLFAAFLPANASSRFAAVAGLGFALAILVTMTFVVTPLVNPVLREAVDTIPKSWVIQHAIFGLMLGLVPAYWRFYTDDSVRVRMVQASRRAIVVRRSQLPAPRSLTIVPRAKRARTRLNRAELFGAVGKAEPPAPRAARS